MAAPVIIFIGWSPSFPLQSSRHKPSIEAYDACHTLAFITLIPCKEKNVYCVVCFLLLDTFVWKSVLQYAISVVYWYILPRWRPKRHSSVLSLANGTLQTCLARLSGAFPVYMVNVHHKRDVNRTLLVYKQMQCFNMTGWDVATICDHHVLEFSMVFFFTFFTPFFCRSQTLCSDVIGKCWKVYTQLFGLWCSCGVFGVS